MSMFVHVNKKTKTKQQHSIISTMFKFAKSKLTLPSFPIMKGCSFVVELKSYASWLTGACCNTVTCLCLGDFILCLQFFCCHVGGCSSTDHHLCDFKRLNSYSLSKALLLETFYLLFSCYICTICKVWKIQKIWMLFWTVLFSYETYCLHYIFIILYTQLCGLNFQCN